MRPILLLSLVFVACHRVPPPSPAPITHTVLEPNAAGPDTIPCERPVQVTAKMDQRGVREEREWLSEHYPRHGGYGQSLAMKGGRVFDILAFTSAEKRAISACFDITSSYDHY